MYGVLNLNFCTDPMSYTK